MLQAVNRFTLLADDSPEVPTLVKKFYSDFRLSRPDWGKIEKMHEVLRVRLD
jgi:superfamily I DNA and RNA helicase